MSRTGAATKVDELTVGSSGDPARADAGDWAGPIDPEGREREEARGRFEVCKIGALAKRECRVVAFYRQHVTLVSEFKRQTRDRDGYPLRMK